MRMYENPSNHIRIPHKILRRGLPTPLNIPIKEIAGPARRCGQHLSSPSSADITSRLTALLLEGMERKGTKDEVKGGTDTFITFL